MTEALTAATGVKPLIVTPSQDNDLHSHTTSTSWIAHYSENPKFLPPILYVFDYRNDKDKNPPVITDQFPITVHLGKPYLKRLGIHFDRELKFKHYVCIQASKALKVANTLRCFGNTIRGIPPRLSKQVISAFVLPITHFGSPTCWPGKTRMKGNRIISNKVGILIKELDKVHKAAARAILSVCRTTSTTVLCRESGLSPAELTLVSLSRRAAIITCRLDSRHPIYE
ncbi:hypothetical protein EPUL_001631 [Erysiphe pulchra]|uniref:Uncharacterized protein n=1 Tax=Erysiphe pulchra TaxID=225359 RepID=A0A2S4PX54_9PEZI|nr:hypothetical protein EPUL_001631 [Erysiphe pulchra]